MSTPQSSDKLLISRGGVSYSITYSDLNGDAVQALADAASAQSTADAALPKAGGTMTGDLTSTAGSSFTGNITTGSRLGVGTTSPNYDVCVEGSNPFLCIYNTDATSNDSHSVTIQSYGADTTTWNKMALSGSSIDFQTYGATRVGITNDGLTFGGNTGASRALDHYEEGSWTPVFKLGSTTASGTFEGHFTRIGRMVTASCSLQISSLNSGTGENQISGLPYTVGNLYSGTTVQGGGSVTYFANGGNRERPTYTFTTIQGTTTGAIYGGSNSASSHQDLDIRLSDNSFANNSSIRIVFTYFV